MADWARGLTAWVLDVPGGEGTDATLRKRAKQARHGMYRVSPSGATGGATAGPSCWGQGAGMVVGWG